MSDNNKSDEQNFVDMINNELNNLLNLFQTDKRDESIINQYVHKNLKLEEYDMYFGVPHIFILGTLLLIDHPYSRLDVSQILNIFEQNIGELKTYVKSDGSNKKDVMKIFKDFYEKHINRFILIYINLQRNSQKKYKLNTHLLDLYNFSNQELYSPIIIQNIFFTDINRIISTIKFKNLKDNRSKDMINEYDLLNSKLKEILESNTQKIDLYYKIGILKSNDKNNIKPVIIMRDVMGFKYFDRIKITKNTIEYYIGRSTNDNEYIFTDEIYTIDEFKSKINYDDYIKNVPDNNSDINVNEYNKIWVNNLLQFIYEQLIIGYNHHLSNKINNGVIGYLSYAFTFYYLSEKKKYYDLKNQDVLKNINNIINRSQILNVYDVDNITNTFYFDINMEINIEDLITFNFYYILTRYKLPYKNYNMLSKIDTNSDSEFVDQFKKIRNSNLLTPVINEIIINQRENNHINIRYLMDFNTYYTKNNNKENISDIINAYLNRTRKNKGRNITQAYLQEYINDEKKKQENEKENKKPKTDYPEGIEEDSPTQNQQPENQQPQNQNNQTQNPQDKKQQPKKQQPKKQQPKKKTKKIQKQSQIQNE